MKSKSAALILAASLTVAGTTPQAQAGVVEKARFLFHLGAAYYAFNTWVWKPYRQYKFQAGAPSQKTNIVKAGLALAFAATQVNAAIKMTRNTNDPFLQKIGSLLPNFGKSLSSVANNLKAGRFDEQGLQSLNRQTNTLLNLAESQGQPIRPVAVPIPGL
ncbi:hypothetical protein [Deinococcus hopiensis]|uniref:Uncharacterized protein n=1 Tax=Deinococcus hopiensis KR-140 TaxID=695939 RepID=A0A1W1V689_9DEIO|nr:hypothetical protein [Deinococcus hopiensis]SMB88888.1 hypothetical protein SAMN00790413_00211 [Deinococcus hopiensis KR-140]